MQRNSGIKVNGVVKGQAMLFQMPNTPWYGLNTFHSSTLSDWATEFNGYAPYVSKEWNSVALKITWNGKSVKRVHIRDMAELCGSHWLTGITWTP